KGQIPCKHFGSRDGSQCGSGSAVPVSLIVEEKKSFVLNDRTAHLAAKLILPEAWLRRGEGIPSVKHVVAQEFEYAGMNVIGPGFRGDIDVGAGGRTESSRSDVGLNLEFLNGVD